MSGVVATGSKLGDASPSSRSRSRSTSMSGTSSPSSAIRARGSPSPSTTRTSASRRRMSSASGPKRMLSGTATAPSLAAATCATAVSGRWGRTMPTRSPGPTPRPRRALARRLESSASSPNVTVRVISRPSVTRIAGSPRGCRSHTSTPEVEDRRQLPAERPAEVLVRRAAQRVRRRPTAARASRGRSAPSGRARRPPPTRRPRARPPRAGRGRRSGSRRRPGRSRRRRRP